MAFDPVGETINKTEAAGEKFADHVADGIPGTVANTLSGVLPLLEAGDIVIRISLEKKQQ